MGAFEGPKAAGVDERCELGGAEITPVLPAVREADAGLKGAGSARGDPRQSLPRLFYPLTCVYQARLCPASEARGVVMPVWHAISHDKREQKRSSRRGMTPRRA